jgi:HlyD family secretion protein
MKKSKKLWWILGIIAVVIIALILMFTLKKGKKGELRVMTERSVIDSIEVTVTYTVIIDAPNPETKLFPGMTANVSITTKKESGVCIPMTALFASIDPEMMKQLEKKGYTFKSLYKNQEEVAQGLKDITKKTLWVKRGENAYEQVSVTVGLNNGVNTLIPEGLREGEEVVISVSEAMEGMPSKGTNEGGSNPFKMGPPQKRER